MIRRLPEYSEVLLHRREDGPREKVAHALDSIDPPRADCIRAGLQGAQLEADAIVQGRDIPSEVAQLWRRVRDLLKEHGGRWALEDEQPLGGTWLRGFLEIVSVSSKSQLDLVEVLLDGWPILHMEIDCAPIYPWFESVSRMFPRLVSLDLAEPTDADVVRLLSSTALKTLRCLTLRGRGESLTERALHAVCEADLPQLEDLRVVVKGMRDPSEGMLSYDSFGAFTDAQIRPFGEELEAKYGWKKYLHAASRFSVYPYHIDALDVLPPLPDDLQVRPRRWE